MQVRGNQTASPVLPFSLRRVKMTSRILRLPQVLEVTGLSRSTIYLRMADGSFPKQVSLGGRAVG